MCDEQTNGTRGKKRRTHARMHAHSRKCVMGDSSPSNSGVPVHCLRSRSSSCLALLILLHSDTPFLIWTKPPMAALCCGEPCPRQAPGCGFFCLKTDPSEYSGRHGPTPPPCPTASHRQAPTSSPADHPFDKIIKHFQTRGFLRTSQGDPAGRGKNFWLVHPHTIGA